MIAAGFWAGLATGGAAHPHIFIDAGMEVIFDDQARATGLRITWSYDDLFSLMLVEDRGLDPDFDGVLTPEEATAISGFDMEWQPGYAGDTYALMVGACRLDDGLRGRQVDLDPCSPV